MDRELLQDSNAVNESFWDGLGVEFEAKYILTLGVRPVGESARDGGNTGGPGTEGHGEARDAEADVIVAHIFLEKNYKKTKKRKQEQQRKQMKKNKKNKEH